MLSRVRNCSFMAGPAFQHFSGKGMRNQVKLFPTSGLQVQSLFKFPHFSFTNTINENKPEEAPLTQKETPVDPAKETTQEKEKEEVVEEIRENFIDFMKKEIKPEDLIREYSNPLIFEVSRQGEGLTKNRKSFGGLAFVFGGITFYTFMNVSAWGAILPGALFLVILNAWHTCKYVSQKLINGIELVDPHHVKIYPFNLYGKDILCNIKDIKLVGMDHSKSFDGTIIYYITAHFFETVKKKKHWNMSMPISQRWTTVENMDLLKCILYGRVDEVAKFKLVKKEDSFADEFGTAETPDLNKKETPKEKEEEMEDLDVEDSRKASA